VLTLSLRKREEAKPKQIKVNVGTAPVNQAAPKPHSNLGQSCPGAR
jgi:hypothetical protein